MRHWVGVASGERVAVGCALRVTQIPFGNDNQRGLEERCERRRDGVGGSGCGVTQIPFGNDNQRGLERPTVERG